MLPKLISPRFSKPAHNRYIFCNLDDATYERFACGYSVGKRNGIRGIYCWAAGMGVLEIVKEVVGGKLILYGRRKFGMVILSGFTWIGGPLVPMVTNGTQILNITKKVHTGISFAMECFEDSNNLMLMPFDLALFGQVIPVGKEGRFDLIENPGQLFE